MKDQEKKNLRPRGNKEGEDIITVTVEKRGPKLKNVGDMVLR